jgi:hypothetical protein
MHGDSGVPIGVGDHRLLMSEYGVDAAGDLHPQGDVVAKRDLGILLRLDSRIAAFSFGGTPRRRCIRTGN